jgi:hypothetical protein
MRTQFFRPDNEPRGPKAFHFTPIDYLDPEILGQIQLGLVSVEGRKMAIGEVRAGGSR